MKSLPQLEPVVLHAVFNAVFKQKLSKNEKKNAERKKKDDFIWINSYLQIVVSTLFPLHFITNLIDELNDFVRERGIDLKLF